MVGTFKPSSDRSNKTSRGGASACSQLELEYKQVSNVARTMAGQLEPTPQELESGVHAVFWLYKCATWADRMSQACASCDLQELHELLGTAATDRDDLVATTNLLPKKAGTKFDSAFGTLYTDARSQAFQRVLGITQAEFTVNPGADYAVIEFWDVGRGSK